MHPGHAGHGLRAAGRPTIAGWPSSRPAGGSRINIHGAADLETGQTRTIEVATVDAFPAIRPLTSVEANYPARTLIHVFPDNARYHHAKAVRACLAGPGRRIKPHFIPAHCPHLNPIERLWGPAHKNITHNKTYDKCGQSAGAMLDFPRSKVPENRAAFRDTVTGNFRVIPPKDFRVMA